MNTSPQLPIVKFKMPSRRKPSLKLIKAGGEWSVRSVTNTTDNLSEAGAWEMFMHRTSFTHTAELLKNGKVVAQRSACP